MLSSTALEQAANLCATALATELQKSLDPGQPRILGCQHNYIQAALFEKQAIIKTGPTRRFCQTTSLVYSRISDTFLQDPPETAAFISVVPLKPTALPFDNGLLIIVRIQHILRSSCIKTNFILLKKKFNQ
jgi:hypothetical protein